MKVIFAGSLETLLAEESHVKAQANGGNQRPSSHSWSYSEDLWRRRYQ